MALLLCGCSGFPNAEPGAAVDLTAALANADQQSFLSAFAPAEANQVAAGQLFDNLRLFDQVGIDRGQASIEVSWRLPRDLVTREASVPVRQEGGLLVLAAAAQDAPLWQLGRLRVVETSEGTVLSTGEDPQHWAELLTRAVAVVTEVGLDDPAGVVRPVVELPATDAAFERRAGKGRQQAAAVSRCVDEDRWVAVNPVVTDQPDHYLVGLLAHEVVHLETGSACGTPAPEWLVEGIAEWVAWQADPQSRTDGQQLLVKAGSELSEELPRIPAGADAARMRLHYAAAAQVIEAAVDEQGREETLEWVSDVIAGTRSWQAASPPELLRWYRESLAAL